jgi:hypothetical protein
MWSRGNSICREETTELKRPVCKRGSILLGELIAIKIVLEYIHVDQPEIRRKIEQLRELTGRSGETSGRS